MDTETCVVSTVCVKGERPVVVAVEGVEKLQVAVEGGDKRRWTQECNPMMQ